MYIKQEWFTPAEVAVHNKASDCWVSLHGKVLNLTPWLDEQFRFCKCMKSCPCPVKSWNCCDECVEYCNCFSRGYMYCETRRLVMTILAFAGKDVSHWFKGDDWVQYTHPVTCTTTTYHQHGHGLREPVVPSTKWRPVVKPWWLNDGYNVGKVTAKTRSIRITNMLTSSTVTLEVCSEETIYQIMMRYLPHNPHMMSYTWRHMGRRLHYNKTLTENGIPDERDRFTGLDLPENLHIPAILIYYNDDLTEEPPMTDCFCSDYTCELKRPDKCYDAKLLHK